jgi:type I restriction enzyme, S subunit
VSDVLQFTAGFAGPATTPLRQAIEYAQTGPFGTQLTADEYVDGGVPVINPTHIQRGHIAPDDSTTVTPEKAEDLARYRLAVGDIVLGRKGEVDKSALVNQQSEGYVCGSDAMALRPRLGTVPDYLWWFLQSSEAHSQLEFWSVGTTVSGLNQNTIRKVRLPLPDVQEQRRIASYLDRETARIGTLIEEQQRLIEMLRERRDSAWAAHVNEARRLGQTLSVRRVIESIVDGPFGSSLTSAHYSDDGARVIRLGNIGVNEFKDGDAAFIPLDYAEELEAHAVEQGDVVVAGLGDDKMPLGRAAVVPALGPAIVKADCYRLRPNEKVSAAYLAWVMSAPQTRSQIMLLARGSTRARLNTKVVQQVEVPFPDRTTQDALVVQSDAETVKIDRLIAESERFVELSRERRAALITAAVTGQIDVREMI